MKKLLLLIAFTVTLCPVFAQKYHIEGWIYDSFTHEKIDSTTVTLYSPKDSSVVEQFQAKTLGWWQVYNDINAPGKYILKISKEGYEDYYKNVSFRYVKYRKTGSSIGTIYLKKLPRRTVNLGEVRVTATKIKMVVKGDTVVYNADAFMLSKGSMLDELLKKLPGMRIDRSGQIFMNGELVQSLLVNGEHFFKGNPRVALENLPAYMVDKVKVYGKLDDRLVALGIDPREHGAKLPLVVDVNLKKEYSIGFVGNVKAGYGTDNHYSARFFGLRFTPQSRFAIIANSNDVESNGHYDDRGNWQEPNGTLAGDKKTHEVRTDYLFADKNKKWKISDNINWKWTKENTKNFASTVTFPQEGGNIYSRSANLATNRNWFISLTGTNSYTPKRGTFFEFKPNVSYTHYNNRAYDRTADFTRQLTERYMGQALDSLFMPDGAALYRQNLISSLQDLSQSRGDLWHAEGNGNGTIRYGLYDRLNFQYGGTYDHAQINRLHSYGDALGGNRNKTFEDNRNKSYNYFAGGNYVYVLSFDYGMLGFIPHYKYTQIFESDRRPFYQLAMSKFSDWDIYELSSNRDALSEYIDYQNAYYSRVWNKTHQGGMQISYDWWKDDDNTRKFSVDVDLPVRNNYRRLAYERGEINTVVRKIKWFFEPSIEIELGKKKNKDRSSYKISYDYSSSAPSLTYQINYQDTETPLIVRYGNNRLKDSHTHHAVFTYNRQMQKNAMMYNFRIDYSLWQNMISQMMTYDKSTGVRTYHPETINGNWGITGSAGFSSRVFGNIYLTNDLSVNYRNSDDYITLADNPTSVRSSVRRTLSSERLNLSYSRDNYALSVHGGVTWNHSEGNRFATLNAYDYNYGGEIDFSLPLKMRLRSNITIHTRRGYSDDQYNTTQPIWNAKLERSFFNGKLGTELYAFDILNKMSEYSYNINAQMQRESYTNVLRRYIMLSFIYRFNINKKVEK